MKVSILVPAFNEEKTIERVLNKLLSLPIDDFEIIVVDDGSIDSTGGIVRRIAFGVPKIRFFLRPKTEARRRRLRGLSRKVRGKS